MTAAVRPFAGTNFKGARTSTSTLRKRKAGRPKRAENANKEQVREREHHKCRFPLCTCRLFNLFLEVSHREHKGMGGDPSGKRSVPELMLLICNVRHKEGVISIDKGTLRWEPLTDAGANGAIVWFVDVGALSAGTLALGTWVEVAREVSAGMLEPISENNRAILETLGGQIVKKFR